MSTAPTLTTMKETLIKAIKLAEILHSKADRAEGPVMLDLAKIANEFPSHRKSKEYVTCFNFLNALPAEKVLGLMTIMYIGRDNDEEDAEDKNALYEKRYQEFANWKKEQERLFKSNRV